MDKFWAKSILDLAPVNIFSPGMIAAEFSKKKEIHGDEKSEKRSSSTNGRNNDAEVQRRHVSIAPAFDGVYCFETIVLH
jgi:hypothetical protein